MSVGLGQGYSATLDMTLNFLKALALSPAMATEIAVYKTILNTEPLSIPITDALGAQIAVDLAPTDAGQLSYVADSLGAVFTAEQTKLLGPWPLMEIIGLPGRQQNSQTAGQRFTDDVVAGEVYSINVQAWSSGEDAKHTQLESAILAYCFKSLVRRNERLGGLVQLIQPLGPVQAQAGGRYEATTLSGSLVRYEALALLP